MPLALLNQGEKGTIASLRGRDDVVRHLENMGFAPGAEISVVGRNNAGMILSVKGCRIALDRSLASKVILA